MCLYLFFFFFFFQMVFLKLILLIGMITTTTATISEVILRKWVLDISSPVFVLTAYF